VGSFSGEALALEPPEIVGCTEWGARPSSREVAVAGRRPVKILIHHTATPNVADLSREGAVRLARSIQSFHMDRRGWPDTGQHFTVSRGGVLLEGRHRSLEVLRGGRRQVEGAHCTGQNLVAVGIENEGSYSAVNPPDKLWDGLLGLCAYICQQYRIAPTRIFGHRDFKDTACPGDRLYAALPRLRTQVAELLGQEPAQTQARPESWPLLRVADRGPAVEAAQHLLRDAGITKVEATGQFDRRTVDAVRQLQRTRGCEEVNGMICGESWPVLTRPVARGEGGHAERAVQALLRGRGGKTVPDVVTEPVWRHLLATATTIE
jgi:hypothetical protein